MKFTGRRQGVKGAKPRRTNRAPRGKRERPSPTVRFDNMDIPVVPGTFMVTLYAPATHGAPAGSSVGPPAVALGKTLAEIATLVRSYVSRYRIGSTNYYGGRSGAVYDDRAKQVAEVSYNGRVWTPGPRHHLEGEITGEALQLSPSEFRRYLSSRRSNPAGSRPHSLFDFKTGKVLPPGQSSFDPEYATFSQFDFETGKVTPPKAVRAPTLGRKPKRGRRQNPKVAGHDLTKDQLFVFRQMARKVQQGYGSESAMPGKQFPGQQRVIDNLVKKGLLRETSFYGLDYYDATDAGMAIVTELLPKDESGQQIMPGFEQNPRPGRYSVRAESGKIMGTFGFKEEAERWADTYRREGMRVEVCDCSSPEQLRRENPRSIFYERTKFGNSVMGREEEGGRFSIGSFYRHPTYGGMELAPNTFAVFDTEAEAVAEGRRLVADQNRRFEEQQRHRRGNPGWTPPEGERRHAAALYLAILDTMGDPGSPRAFGGPAKSRQGLMRVFAAHAPDLGLDDIYEFDEFLSNLEELKDPKAPAWRQVPAWIMQLPDAPPRRSNPSHERYWLVAYPSGRLLLKRGVFSDHREWAGPNRENWIFGPYKTKDEAEKARPGVRKSLHNDPSLRRENPGLAILNPLPEHLQTFAEQQQLTGPEIEEFNQAVARYCEFHGVPAENISIEQIGETDGDQTKFLVGMGATEDVSYSANHKGIYKDSNKRGVPFRHEFPSKPHMATTPDGEMIVIVNRSGSGKRFTVSDWIRG